MAEYSKIAEGTFTVATPVASHFVNLPFVPNTFEIWNLTEWGDGDGTNALVQYAIGFAEQAAGSAWTVQNVATLATLQNIALTSGGFTFIQAGTYQYGPIFTISGITKASAAVVTTTTPHGYAIGDAVLIYGTTGMLQIAGTVYTVQTVPSTTTFTIDVNSTGFAAVATAGFVKKVLYADLYIPEGSAITAVSTGLTTTVTTALNHKFVIGQEVFFVIPPQWGMTQLDTIVAGQTGLIGAQYQQAYVISIPNPNQIVVNVNSTGYTAFSYPTSATAALGVTPAQVLAIGDQNTGYLAPGGIPPTPLTIPGAFVANTRQGVLIGGGAPVATASTAVLGTAGDKIRWRAVYPDLIQDL
jgi:hypothetical protein